MQERRTLKRGEDIGRDERTGRQKGWGGERGGGEERQKMMEDGPGNKQGEEEIVDR